MRPKNIVVSLALGCLVLSAPPVGAQKGKPSGDQPVKAQIMDRPGDRIRSDNAGPYDGIINAVGEFQLPLDAVGSRWVSLDFTERLDDGTCGMGCVFPPSSWPQALGDNEYFSMRTNVVDAAGNEVEGGLVSISLGETKRARFDPTFADPDGRDLHFVLRYYPQAFAHSSYVWVTRETLKTWVIQTEANDDTAPGYEDAARLVAHIHRARRSNSLSDEGLFRMPFQILVTLP